MGRDEIVEGVARGLWALAFADWHESATPAERKATGVPRGNVDFYDDAPETPEAAYDAARDLIDLIEASNGCKLEALHARARAAEGQKIDDESFGAALSMMGTGQGSSWFDDHAEFEIEMPLSFEAHYDGEYLDWSGGAGPRRNPPPKKTGLTSGRRIVTDRAGSPEQARRILERRAGRGEQVVYESWPPGQAPETDADDPVDNPAPRKKDVMSAERMKLRNEDRAAGIDRSVDDEDKEIKRRMKAAKTASSAPPPPPRDTESDAARQARYAREDAARAAQAKRREDEAGRRAVEEEGYKRAAEEKTRQAREQDRRKQAYGWDGRRAVVYLTPKNILSSIKYMTGFAEAADAHAADFILKAAYGEDERPGEPPRRGASWGFIEIRLSTKDRYAVFGPHAGFYKPVGYTDSELDNIYVMVSEQANLRDHEKRAKDKRWDQDQAQQQQRERERRSAPPPPPPPPKSARAILGFSDFGPLTLREVKTRYRELARKHHPDFNGGDASSLRMMQEINVAYEKLVASGTLKDNPAGRLAREDNLPYPIRIR